MPWQRSALEMSHRYGVALLDLIYPPSCEICKEPLPGGREGSERWLCADCLAKLPKIEPPFCERCGEPYDGAISGPFRCGNCADLKLHFDFAIAPYRADGEVRELIHRFKYEEQLHLRGLLASLLAGVFEDPRFNGVAAQEFVLVPVPLHATRKRERGYNQSWELCRSLAKITGLACKDALQRSRATKAQASLTRNMRVENLRGAFQVRPRLAQNGTLKAKRVILVDDVLTTGSTASECARTLLRQAGVQNVVVITAARG